MLFSYGWLTIFSSENYVIVNLFVTHVVSFLVSCSSLSGLCINKFLLHGFHPWLFKFKPFGLMTHYTTTTLRNNFQFKFKFFGLMAGIFWGK